MAVTEKSILTTELRLDVQELYFRYAECLDGGRLQQWPEFFLDSCIYRIMTRRSLRTGQDEDLLSLNSKTSISRPKRPSPACATNSAKLPTLN